MTWVVDYTSPTPFDVCLVTLSLVSCDSCISCRSHFVPLTPRISVLLTLHSNIWSCIWCWCWFCCHVESRLPLLAFPEGATTSGKVGLLKFRCVPFSLLTLACTVRFVVWRTYTHIYGHAHRHVWLSRYTYIEKHIHIYYTSLASSEFCSLTL